MAKRPPYYDQLSEGGKQFVDEAEDFDPFAPDETVAIIGTPKVPKKPARTSPPKRRPRRKGTLKK